MHILNRHYGRSMSLLCGFLVVVVAAVMLVMAFGVAFVETSSYRTLKCFDIRAKSQTIPSSWEEPPASCFAS